MQIGARPRCTLAGETVAGVRPDRAAARQTGPEIWQNSCLEWPVRLQLRLDRADHTCSISYLSYA